MSTSPAPVRTARLRIQLASLGLFAAVAAVIAGSALVLLYRSVITRTTESLVHLVEAQAILLERTYDGELSRTGLAADARAHTLSSFVLASAEFRDFGESGEMVMGERRDGRLHFLLPERSLGGRVPTPVDFGGASGEALQRAVQGETGSGRALDFRDVEVIGAYRYLPGLGVGLVAKLDAAEVQREFIAVAWRTGLIALVVLILGVQLYLRVVGPQIGAVFRSKQRLERGLRVADAATERYATLFRSAADPMLIESLDGTVQEANAAAARVWKREPSAFEGVPITMLFPEQEPSRLVALRGIAARGDEVSGDIRVAVAADGTRRMLSVALTPLQDADGAVNAVSTICTDITDLEVARERLESQNAALEDTVRARTAELERELAVARALAAETRRGHDWVLRGESIAVRALREAIAEHAAATHAVLLTGPTGSGKEAVARAIHEKSARRGAAFLVYDAVSASRSGATPTEPALSSMDFGALLSAAAGGTLLVDGVEYLATEEQEQLSAALASASVGGTRILAAVAGDGGTAIVSGGLDPVLGSALGRHRLTVPALAERRDDIAMLAEAVLAERARAAARGALTFSDRARRHLEEHDWPGNLRELAQVVEAAVRESAGSIVDIAEPLGVRWRTVGGYRLTSLIGQGGMGEVWKAEHALLKRPAAVKLTRRRPDLSANDRMALEQRFRREAQVTASLRSPHTVQLFDFGLTDEGDFFYVMELLDGMSLAAMLRATAAMPPARAAYLVAQACLSLAEAHGRGLVHRDIKPDNLFVCRWDVERDFVKVLDFGIVRRLEAEGETAMTREGLMLGTPAYISPEVASGRPAEAAADIYALGCVLFKMVTGEFVFDTSGGSMALLLAHREEMPRYPSDVSPHQIPPDLDRIILDCLAKNPAERPASALELRDRLLAIPFERPWTDADAAQWWVKRDARVGG